jgi:hypothetical protein
MKRLSWRYVSNIHVYNSFFLAYAEKVTITLEFSEHRVDYMTNGRLRNKGRPWRLL